SVAHEAPVGARSRPRRARGRGLGRHRRARRVVLPDASVAALQASTYTELMADELQISSRPELERPILIAAFRGWNDGGQGVLLVMGYLAKLWEAKRFAEIDPENFFDFQATRPH